MKKSNNVKKELVLTPISWSDVRDKKSTLNFKNSVVVGVVKESVIVPYEYYTLSYSPSLSVKTVDFCVTVPTSGDGIAEVNGNHVMVCTARIETIEDTYVRTPLSVATYEAIPEDETISLDWDVESGSTSPVEVDIVGVFGSSLGLLLTDEDFFEDEDDSDYTYPIQYAAYLTYGEALVGKTPYYGLKLFTTVATPTTKRSPVLSSEKVCEVYKSQEMTIRLAKD